MKIKHSSLPAIILSGALLIACSQAEVVPSDPDVSVEAQNTQEVAATDAAAAPEAPVEVLAPAGTYKSDLSHSSIIWRIDHLGLTKYPARFTRFDATLIIDPDQPEDASLTVTIDPTSVSTEFPYPERADFNDEVANKPVFLNAGEFPQITFVSTDVEMTGPQTAKVTGDLTLTGQTRPVVLDVVYNGSLEAHPFSGRPMLGFSATAELDRTDFGMTAMQGQIGNTIDLLIETEFSRRDEEQAAPVPEPNSE